MKRINFKPFALIVAVAVVLSSCSGLNKMKKNADQINFKVTPEVLEAHASEVDLAVTGRFPSKYFHKKVTLTATPVLKYSEGQTEFEPVTVQGESVEANNKVIANSGGSVTYKDAVDYDKAMAKSELYVNITASQGKKSVDFAPIKIADGVLATSERVVVIPKAILGVTREANNSGKYDPNIDAFQRVVPDEQMADIKYLINRSNLRRDEIEKSEVKALEDYTKKANEDERIDLKDVEVSAYASPDGTIDFNTELAAQRKNTSSEFLAKKLKEAGIDVELKTKYTPEDWDGFKQKMEESNIQDKELILRVLSMYNDPEVREREIRNLSETFTEVADEILPQLRRAKLVTSVDMIGKTDDELKAAAKADPASLNPAELLYAATLFEDLADQQQVYESFVKAYPNDWRGPNNVGYVLASQMKYADAKPHFEKAETLKNDEPVIKNNLGAIALTEGDVAKAETLFGAASGSGEEVNYNLGIVSVKKAEYDKAVRYFSQYEDVNTAIAKMMAGDNNGALRDLEAFQMENCFMKEYLKAVIGARTAKESLLFDSLKAACDINPKMKAEAKVDMEFAKYFNDPKFTAIVD
ncbi:tetratricopeptide repeat protein [Maribellus mangrovi]|uniref:tetratricopeptide repeat protein n=1 Tax=Maribellus mangrovi TaxID=3133146 RepID=UPI0030ED5F11